jgi:hypothetical protein
MGGGRGLLRRLRRLGREFCYERGEIRWMAYRVVLNCGFRNFLYIHVLGLGRWETGLGWVGEINRNISYMVQMR